MQLAWRAAGVAMPVAVALVAAWLLRAPMRHHPYFAVREVALRHHGRLSPERLRQAAGIEPGTSIWDVDVERAKARLEEEPWVRTADVRRELPHRVVIRVREHRPAAIVAVAEPTPALYYVAANGRIFAPVAATDSHDFPYLTGLSATDLSGREAVGPRGIRRALALLRLVARERTGLGGVSEIHVDRTGLTLLPIRPAVPVELGWGPYETKLAHLAVVLRKWVGREAAMAGVTCVFDDQVVVRTRADVGAPKPRRPAGA
jgi:cell division protein FtsQ